MSITRLQQARQMYAMGQRVGRAFGGVMNSDGRRQYGGGSDAGKDGGYGYQGGGTNTAGVAGTGPASSGYSGGNTPSNDGPDNSPNINTGPTYSPPTTNIVDEVALTGFGTVPSVDYSAVGPDSKYQKNITLQNQLLNTPYEFKKMPFIPFISTPINFLGTTLGEFAYNKNIKYFSDNSIGGKINPETGEPFGYGIDGFNDYMKQRQLGNVGGPGKGGSGKNGIMDVYTDETTDGGTGQNIGGNIGDTTTDDELLLRFLGADSTLDPAAAGVANTDELRAMILERVKNLYT
jgi:hypothetical protein